MSSKVVFFFCPRIEAMKRKLRPVAKLDPMMSEYVVFNEGAFFVED